jgi:hypothetical protein
MIGTGIINKMLLKNENRILISEEYKNQLTANYTSNGYLSKVYLIKKNFPIILFLIFGDNHNERSRTNSIFAQWSLSNSYTLSSHSDR